VATGVVAGMGNSFYVGSLQDHLPPVICANENYC
jgi:hypothetical protein